MKKQVFLGGACGHTTWRRELAIPALEAAGVSYYDPQLAFGAWTPAREAEEMRAKDAADVLLFVITGETRGVASVAEAAYLLAARRPLALVVTDVQAGTSFEGRPLSSVECDDLNRGRIFVRSMAQIHGVPVFPEVPAAVQYAIKLVQAGKGGLSLAEVQAVLASVAFRDFAFIVTPVPEGYQLQLQAQEPDAHTGAQVLLHGRQWPISRFASKSEIVQTAFKAVVTWQEHEAREHFRFQGAQVFGPHFDIERLAELWRVTRDEVAS